MRERSQAERLLAGVRAQVAKAKADGATNPDADVSCDADAADVVEEVARCVHDSDLLRGVLAALSVGAGQKEKVIGEVQCLVRYIDESAGHQRLLAAVQKLVGVDSVERLIPRLQELTQALD